MKNYSFQPLDGVREAFKVTGQGSDLEFRKWLQGLSCHRRLPHMSATLICALCELAIGSQNPVRDKLSDEQLILIAFALGHYQTIVRGLTGMLHETPLSPLVA